MTKKVYTAFDCASNDLLIEDKVFLTIDSLVNAVRELDEDVDVYYDEKTRSIKSKADNDWEGYCVMAFEVMN